VIEGISYVKSFREDFGAAIDQQGLDAVIERIEKGNVPVAPRPCEPHEADCEARAVGGGHRGEVDLESPGRGRADRAHARRAREPRGSERQRAAYREPIGADADEFGRQRRRGLHCLPPFGATGTLPFSIRSITASSPC